MRCAEAVGPRLSKADGEVCCQRFALAPAASAKHRFRTGQGSCKSGCRSVCDQFGVELFNVLLLSCVRPFNKNETTALVPRPPRPRPCRTTQICTYTASVLCLIPVSFGAPWGRSGCRDRGRRDVPPLLLIAANWVCPACLCKRRPSSHDTDIVVRHPWR